MDYDADKKRLLGAEADAPMRIKYRKIGQEIYFKI